MKITMYELLGLVKDGKAPKKVKYKDKIYYYHEGYDFNYMYNSSDYMPMDEDKSLFTFPSYKPKDGVMCWDNNTAIDFLNDELEIIEEIINPFGEYEDTSKEEKKIPEKLDWNKNDFTYPEGNLMSEETADMLMEIQDKVNFILDYLKSKGDE